jgi:hypothetical protein
MARKDYRKVIPAQKLLIDFIGKIFPPHFFLQLKKLHWIRRKPIYGTVCNYYAFFQRRKLSKLVSQ